MKRADIGTTLRTWSSAGETTSRLLALGGAGLVIAATFVPVNGGGRGGYPYAIYDTSIQREFELFAAEPLVVALLAALIAFLTIQRMPVFSAGALLAFGAQSSLLFLAHFGAATFGNPQYNSFRPGGVIGIAGALLLMAAGASLLPFTGRRRS